MLYWCVNTKCAVRHETSTIWNTLEENIFEGWESFHWSLSTFDGHTLLTSLRLATSFPEYTLRIIEIVYKYQVSSTLPFSLNTSTFSGKVYRDQSYLGFSQTSLFLTIWIAAIQNKPFLNRDILLLLHLSHESAHTTLLFDTTNGIPGIP